MEKQNHTQKAITPRIRFVDSAYHEIFTIPDGTSIVVTHFDGTTVTHSCTYIDETHAKIGSSVYHMLEFAGIMERSGSIYAPEGGVADYYEVYQADLHADYCFREYEEAKGRISMADYTRVYAGMLGKGTSLETLFARHNQDTRPFGRRMRSMSMSDIVVLHQDGEAHAYYTDSFGFEPIDNILIKTK